jgi:flagellar L-ring protein FlgH
MRTPPENRNSKLQVSNSKPHNGPGGGWRFGTWNLELGILSLALAAFAVPNASAQSLWQDNVSKPMFADKRATSVGDILTIIVQENTSATKKNNTTTAKDAAVDASISTFLYSPGASSFLTKNGSMPALKYGAKNSFNGGGSVDNSQRIVANIAVKVIDVLPNRNLVIEGRRETSFSGEHQTAVLRGIVRPEDITANNNVFSFNIADAKVEINSKGTVDDSQRKGWFTRLWDKLTPF